MQASFNPPINHECLLEEVTLKQDQNSFSSRTSSTELCMAFTVGMLEKNPKNKLINKMEQNTVQYISTSTTIVQFNIEEPEHTRVHIHTVMKTEPSWLQWFFFNFFVVKGSIVSNKMKLSLV